MRRPEEESHHEAGGTVDEASICLAIYGDTLKPDAVSKMLGVRPTRSFEAGHKSGPKSPAIPHGAWFYDLRGKAPLALGDLATMMLAALPTDPAIWRQLRESYKVQIRVGLHMESWNRGFGFSAATLAKLVQIGADMNFDIYAYDDRDA